MNEQVKAVRSEAETFNKQQHINRATQQLAMKSSYCLYIQMSMLGDKIVLYLLPLCWWRKILEGHAPLIHSSYTMKTSIVFQTKIWILSYLWYFLLRLCTGFK